MRKCFTVILTGVLMAALLCLPIAAFSEGTEELVLTAVVAGERELALKAPASGELAPFTVRAGDRVSKGEALFKVEPKIVYATMEGTVAAVYVKPGGSADASAARYGGAMSIDYDNRYEVRANVRTGYNSTQNRDLRAGMPVYLRSANENHFADGEIISVSGGSFTVEVHGGDLVFTQDVKVYREQDYNSKALLARAGLSSVAPYAVTASGTVVEVFQKQGDSVKTGDKLFSYVPDVLEPELLGAANPTAVVADRDLIVKAVDAQQGGSVQKGQSLLRAYEVGAYELVAQAEEGDVGKILVGDIMTVRFEELEIPSVEATVTAVSPLGSEADVSKYAVRLSFQPPEGVWLGMHATVEK